eukprot:m.73382 g.73382  ORF g.73382 m.73382 type:complete len:95 (-) comp13890_c2_seq3:73-357(-)
MQTDGTTKHATLENPDGSVIAGVDDAGHLSLWDVATGELFTSIRKHEVAVNHVAFASDGSMVCTGDQNGTILVWYLSPVEGALIDADKGKCVLS